MIVQYVIHLVFHYRGTVCFRKNKEVVLWSPHKLSRGYDDFTGSSGYTYKHGVVDAIEETSPVIFLFENVTTVADRSKDEHGNMLEPPVQVGICQPIQLYLQNSTVHPVAPGVGQKENSLRE